MEVSLDLVLGFGLIKKETSTAKNGCATNRKSPFGLMEKKEYRLKPVPLKAENANQEIGVPGQTAKYYPKRIVY